MHNELRYSSSSFLEPLFVSWDLAINQWETKSARLVGEILQSIEMLGLQPKQEDAIKATVKRIIYEQANGALDWMANGLYEEKDGKLQKFVSDSPVTSVEN